MEKEIYRDCQRNHACSLGGYAIDGCTEFIQGEEDGPAARRCCPADAVYFGRSEGQAEEIEIQCGTERAMREFAESLGWCMRDKGRHDEINRFCERVSVSRLTFKTWLNNNKKCYLKGTATAACEAENSPP
ncbi:hypothetical protein F3Y22_tig00109972pilonHSYRG00251 [Hibiscus syriacus]|uniref:ZF-HD dimerization-type domain-containing protein n=1 Tax=Hibiscus syriacus TaxID=106335 RepID=A0A6A3BQJ8_HIBSY|nr:hypothetical protein F3Y22_tig00109972pilonHSYRG00251 [Hibiscus syriacus]